MCARRISNETAPTCNVSRYDAAGADQRIFAYDDAWQDQAPASYPCASQYHWGPQFLVLERIVESDNTRTDKDVIFYLGAAGDVGGSLDGHIRADLAAADIAVRSDGTICADGGASVKQG